MRMEKSVSRSLPKEGSKTTQTFRAQLTGSQPPHHTDRVITVSFVVRRWSSRLSHRIASHHSTAHSLGSEVAFHAFIHARTHEGGRFHRLTWHDRTGFVGRTFACSTKIIHPRHVTQTAVFKRGGDGLVRNGRVDGATAERCSRGDQLLGASA